jgi:hypothetical protein
VVAIKKLNNHGLQVQSLSVFFFFRWEFQSHFFSVIFVLNFLLKIPSVYISSFYSFQLPFAFSVVFWWRDYMYEHHAINWKKYHVLLSLSVHDQDEKDCCKNKELKKDAFFGDWLMYWHTRSCDDHKTVMRYSFESSNDLTDTKFELVGGVDVEIKTWHDHVKKFFGCLCLHETQIMSFFCQQCLWPR